MIRVQCPSCGSKLRAPDEALGKKTKCPQCQSIVLVEPGRSAAFDDVLDPEVVRGPDDPYGFADGGDAPATDATAASGEGRKPCPVCGEMIVTTASKCRYCGEIFDPALRSKADPQTLRDFRKNIHGLAGAWIIFSVLCVLAAIGMRALGEQRGIDTAAMSVAYFFIAAVWFLVGLFAALKHMWAVYVGLAFSYLNGLGSLMMSFNLAAGGPGGGGIAPWIGVGIMAAVVVQAHRTISLAGKLKKARIPLTAKP